VHEVVHVFSAWASLRRDERRKLMRALGLRVWVSRPVQRLLHVDRVEIGVLRDASIYKKMKRLNIE
jgi:hypothetical protein